ncbi:MAG TPA: head-tail adaptor protein, partial [Alphaproteobacteria bacterium]|nr:head-tail adaptor protein [Alphaproteobacteria bacterium]
MIGDLRHRVTLQQVVDVPDAGGGSTQSWQDVATLWAEIL